MAGFHALFCQNENCCRGAICKKISYSATIEVVDGNNNEDCSDLLKEYFHNNGFYELEVEITGEDVGAFRGQTNCQVQDEAQLLISISGDGPENFANDISAFYASPDGFLSEVSGGIKAFVTKDENICRNIVQTSCGLTDISIEQIESALANIELGHWAHISGEVGSTGTMFISGKTPLVDYNWSTQDPKARDLLEKTKQHFDNIPAPFAHERPVTLMMVTGAFATQPCDDPSATETTSDLENCPNQNNDDLICISPCASGWGGIGQISCHL